MKFDVDKFFHDYVEKSVKTSISCFSNSESTCSILSDIMDKIVWTGSGSVYKKVPKNRLLRWEKRIFFCQKCPKTFKDKSNFKVHERIHTNDRPFL
jgi:hypothetical protein